MARDAGRPRTNGSRRRRRRERDGRLTRSGSGAARVPRGRAACGPGGDPGARGVRAGVHLPHRFRPDSRPVKGPGRRLSDGPFGDCGKGARGDAGVCDSPVSWGIPGNRQASRIFCPKANARYGRRAGARVAPARNGGRPVGRSRRATTCGGADAGERGQAPGLAVAAGGRARACPGVRPSRTGPETRTSGRWRRGMHQRPDFQNRNKRSAVCKFDLAYSDSYLPTGTASCDGSHRRTPAPVTVS